jgi:hypothetical protein
VTLISAVRTYILTYSGLATGAPVLVDFLGQTPTQYAIVPLPGARIVERYIDGGTVREFPFAIQSMESTADDLERIENSGFYEALAAWFETQTEAGTLPILGTGKTATDIEALGWAYLFEQGDSATGVYQIQAKLTYDQIPP